MEIWLAFDILRPLFAYIFAACLLPPFSVASKIGVAGSGYGLFFWGWPVGHACAITISVTCSKFACDARPLKTLLLERSGMWLGFFGADRLWAAVRVGHLGGWSLLV